MKDIHLDTPRKQGASWLITCSSLPREKYMTKSLGMTQKEKKGTP